MSKLNECQTHYQVTAFCLVCLCGEGNMYWDNWESA